MWNRSLVPYHQRPHWFHIVRRNTLEQSCPIKTENKISCGFIHCWTKKCETWHLEEIKVFGIFGNALFWKAQKQPIWINNCLESRELSQEGKEKSSMPTPRLPAGNCCACCSKAPRSFSADTEEYHHLLSESFESEAIFLYILFAYYILKHLHVLQNRDDT